MSGEQQSAEKAHKQVWFPDDQHGYSIALCECEGGPYLGARQMGTPCVCERCRRITPEQFEFLYESLQRRDGLPQPLGRPQGGMKSDAARAAYWRMNYEAAIGALADLIAENTENVEFARDFYAHNADLLSDYWRTEFARVFPPGQTGADS